MMKKIALAAISLAALAGCGISSPLQSGLAGYEAAGSKGSVKGAADWTVFVYMAGDNSLSSAVNSDLAEMKAGLSSDRVHFVVLADQEQDGDSRILDIRYDSASKKVVETKVANNIISSNNEINTGDVKNFEKFVNWGIKNYPSQRSMMVMWNHGGGAFTDPDHLKSFCWDDTSNSHLNLVDLWKTAQAVSSKAKFDIIGFDTCLLGHLETAYQMRNVSSFLVSSEKVEPGDGWDYAAIGKAMSKKPGMYPREFSAEIVKSYNAFYKPSGQETTLSAIDLEKLGDRVVPAVNALAKNLQASLQTNNAVRGMMQQAIALYPEADGENDAIDLGMFGNMVAKNAQLSQETRSLAAKLNTEIQRATVANLTTETKAGLYTGMKIYASENYNAAYGNASHQSFGTADWAKFVQAYGTK